MRFNSKLIHAGWDSDENSEGSITVPIYRTTAYQFNNTEHAANLFGLKEFGNIYSRLGNPTVGALEARLTALEDGAMCVALSSGTSAVMYSLINIRVKETILLLQTNFMVEHIQCLTIFCQNMVLIPKK